MEFCVTFMWVMVGLVARRLTQGWRRPEAGAFLTRQPLIVDHLSGFV